MMWKILLDEAVEENKRLREALEFYRDGIKTIIEHSESHFNETIHIAPDDGTIAQQALDGEISHG